MQPAGVDASRMNVARFVRFRARDQFPPRDGNKIPDAFFKVRPQKKRQKPKENRRGCGETTALSSSPEPKG